uniref:Uncharacterized protein n=1 Tax=Candidatus Berkiella cookevillensis TaxID=437022 RepID=A0A0Q9YAD2_9GAMM
MIYPFAYDDVVYFLTLKAKKQTKSDLCLYHNVGQLRNEQSE